MNGLANLMKKGWSWRGCSSGSGVPSTTNPHQQLVTGADGETEWQEQLAYEDASVKTIGSDLVLTRVGEAVDGECMYVYTTGPLSENFSESIMCTVKFGDHEYTGEAVSFTNEVVVEGYLIGNSDLIGGAPVNPDPNAALGILYIPGGLDGMYLALVTTLTYEENISLTITGEFQVIKQIDEKFIPEIPVEPIIITFATDGTITSDTDFNTAWSLTDTELQTRIIIKDNRGSNAMYHWTGSALSVTRKDLVLQRYLQIRFNEFADWEDTARQAEITRYLRWDGSQTESALYLENHTAQSLHDLHYQPEDSDEEYFYMRGWANQDSGRWSCVTAAQLREDLSIMFVVNATVTLVEEGVDDAYTATLDKTYSEVLAAIQNRQVVQCHVARNSNVLILPVFSYSEGKMTFMNSFGNGIYAVLMWNSDGTSTYTDSIEALG